MTAIRKQLKTLQKEFVDRLQQARAELDDAAARKLVLGILKAELDSIVNREVTRHRALVSGAFQIWWDKYQVTLGSLEEQRGRSTQRLHTLLRQLGYVG